MRVLVAGATGVLGIPTVRSLAAAGHKVVGLVRSAEKARRMEALGASAVVGDLLRPDSLRSAAKNADAIIHLAASDDDFERVRVDGCRNLLAVAERAGVQRFVVGSGYWVFGHHDGTITEESAIEEHGAGAINLAAERLALAASRPGTFDVIVARPGMVYGPGAWFARMLDQMRSGVYRYVGDGNNRWSPVHPANVGEAYRAIVERGHPGNVYLVVDDAPVAVREFAEFVAERIGARPPQSVPFEEAAKVLGEVVARALSANQAASNAKLKSLGWSPRYPTYREGVPDVLRHMGLGRRP